MQNTATKPAKLPAINLNLVTLFAVDSRVGAVIYRDEKTAAVRWLNSTTGKFDKEVVTIDVAGTTLERK